MSSPLQPIQAPDRVLSTLNVDGSRRWLRPKPSSGHWHRIRRVVAYALMLIFFLIPYVKLGGKPAMLLDLPRREFTLFGTTFLSTDMALFMLLLVSSVIAIFIATALFGRVWCGWACPQTVYMEFLFRPVERLLEGGWRGSQQLDRHGGLSARRIAKHAVYVVLAMFLSHTFLAYFVGIDTLVQWVQRSPVEHPTSFFIMAGTTALIFFDFAYFREQTCLVACPYGRLQAVLLDRRSLIVGYDAGRGEPRTKGVKTRPETAGDCVDCGLCVLTCPTGIDIRDGLQMECIHCTQCADACDAVMDKVGKPRGLIRYSSRDGLEGRSSRMLRPRVVVYPAMLAVGLGLFGFGLGTRSDTEVTVLRGLGAPYTVTSDGRIANATRIKIANRAGAAREFRIALENGADAALIAPINPFPVAARQTQTTTVFIELPPSAFRAGDRRVSLRVSDGARFSGSFPVELLGPTAEDSPGTDASARDEDHHSRGER